MKNKIIVKYEDILNNEEIKTYISKADLSLESMGFTDHAFEHVKKCAETVKNILSSFDYSSREINLGQIAAYMHDIGNVVNRHYHAQTGAVMAFRILDNLGMSSEDIATIVNAIGNHDEKDGYPVNAVTAALILADKTDVRRSRVRPINNMETDIHDRVNYAVQENALKIDKKKRTLTLKLTLDTNITPIMDYFEIFLDRMRMCVKAAKTLNLTFKLIINNQTLI